MVHNLYLVKLWTLLRRASKAVRSLMLKLCKIHITQLLLILPLPDDEHTNSLVVGQSFSELLELAAVLSKCDNLDH
jgi:hypothetical protein